MKNVFVIHIMTLTVRLPEPIENQLNRFCETMGVSKSQVVQSALKDWFAKPTGSTAHPLLAYVQTASNAAPVADWSGPYSKERLHARVLATKNNSASRNKNKGKGAISLVKKPDVHPGADTP